MHLVPFVHPKESRPTQVWSRLQHLSGAAVLMVPPYCIDKPTSMQTSSARVEYIVLISAGFGLSIVTMSLRREDEKGDVILKCILRRIVIGNSVLVMFTSSVYKHRGIRAVQRVRCGVTWDIGLVVALAKQCPSAVWVCRVRWKHCIVTGNTGVGVEYNAACVHVAAIATITFADFPVVRVSWHVIRKP